MTSDIPSYVINLDRAPERLAHITREFAAQGLPFERVRAIDGAALSQADLARVYDPVAARAAYHAPMQRGEIGCSLSHFRAWELYLRQSGAPFAAFFEDDAAFRGQLAPIFAALAAVTRPPWGIVKLWSREKWLVQQVADLGNGYRLVREPVVSKRAVGQIISRAAAERLVARSLPIRRPVDVDLQYPWELDIEILTVTPSLVVDVGEQLSGKSSTKVRSEGFDRRKLGREVRRTAFRTALVARSIGHFAALWWDRP